MEGRSLSERRGEVCEVGVRHWGLRKKVQRKLSRELSIVVAEALNTVEYLDQSVTVYARSVFVCLDRGTKEDSRDNNDYLITIEVDYSSEIWSNRSRILEEIRNGVLRIIQGYNGVIKLKAIGGMATVGITRDMRPP